MIRVFESFAGYGSQAMALKRLDIPFEVVGISEIDKYAIQAYTAVHGATPNFGDICKIDWDSVPDFDLFTYSFPCTDISSAGQQKGLTKGSGTRSGLLWECERAIEIKRPKYLLMENVKALVQSSFIGEFKEWQNILTQLGYTSYTKVLNAKDYGVPQNRERVFMVSILGDEWFNFPAPIKLDKCLADVLEDNVDEKYFLSQKMVDCFLRQNEIAKEKGNGFKFEPNNVSKAAKCITTKSGNRADDNFVSEPINTDANGLCRTIKARYCKTRPANFESKTGFGATGVRCTEVCQIGNLIEESNFDNPQRGRIYSENGISPTITTCAGGNLEPKILDCKIDEKTYIRRLTERECFRLMGVSEEDIDKIQNCFVLPERALSYSKEERQRYMDSLTKEQLAKKGISKTQQYKMAGNSIVVDVLVAIFSQMFCPKSQQRTLFG